MNRCVRRPVDSEVNQIMSTRAGIFARTVANKGEKMAKAKPVDKDKAKQEELGMDPADKIRNVGDLKPTDEKVLVHMLEYHGHGHCGNLQKGEVYRMNEKWATAISADHKNVLRIIDDDEAEEILLKNQEAHDKQLKAQEQRNKKAEKKAREDAGSVKDA